MGLKVMDLKTWEMPPDKHSSRITTPSSRSQKNPTRCNVRQGKCKTQPKLQRVWSHCRSREGCACLLSAVFMCCRHQSAQLAMESQAPVWDFQVSTCTSKPEQALKLCLGGTREAPVQNPQVLLSCPCSFTKGKAETPPRHAGPLSSTELCSSDRIL